MREEDTILLEREVDYDIRPAESLYFLSHFGYEARCDLLENRLKATAVWLEINGFIRTEDGLLMSAHKTEKEIKTLREYEREALEEIRSPSVVYNLSLLGDERLRKELLERGFLSKDARGLLRHIVPNYSRTENGKKLLSQLLKLEQFLEREIRRGSAELSPSEIAMIYSFIDLARSKEFREYGKINRTVNTALDAALEVEDILDRVSYNDLVKMLKRPQSPWDD